MNKPTTLITQDLKKFLAFMKQHYYLYHASNVFFRDLHFGVMTYLESYGIRMTYTDSENVTREVIGALVERGILTKIDDRSWLLNYVEYRKEPKTAEPQAKPATAQAPAASA